jgi:hypothetical protein
MANTRELSQLASLLVVNDETRNIGIGTTNPTSKLSVNGSGNFIGSVTSSDGFYVNGSLIGGSITGTNIVGTALSVTGISTFTNGPVLVGGGDSTGTSAQRLQVTGGASFTGVGASVGIGTTNPRATLQVKDSLLVSAGTTESYDIAIKATLSDGGTLSFEDPDSTKQYFSINKDTNTLFAVNKSNYESAITVNSTGNLGIGTTTPTSKLWVNGDGYFVGVITANRIFSTQYGEFVGGSISGTNLVGTALSVTGISTFANGPVLIGSATSTGTASQKLQVTGGAYIGGSVGIGTTNPRATLQVKDSLLVSAGTTESYDIAIKATLSDGGTLSFENPDSTKQYFSINKDTNTLFAVNKSNYEAAITVNSTGNLGIGTTTPSQKLWVDGSGYFTGILTASGSISGTNIVGTSLSISGISTLGVTSTTNLTSQQLNVSGVSTFSNVVSFTNNNIRIGDVSTGSSITTGTHNFFAGAGAGAATTSGNDNVFFGRCAGCTNTTGNDNVFFGRCAGCANTTGKYNNFFGNAAGRCNTTGSTNNFLGQFSGYSNTSGSCNNFFGNNAGSSNTSGCHNNFFGQSAGSQNTIGNNNNFLGRCAGKYNTTGYENNFFGAYAGFSIFGAIGAFSSTSTAPSSGSGTYSNISATGGSGSGATFNVSLINLGGGGGGAGGAGGPAGGGGGIFYAVSISNVGQSYTVGNTLTIDGSLVGGVSGTNNITITVMSTGGIGGCNNFFGACAGRNNTSGFCNNFFGPDAGRCNTSGSQNNFFGAYAGRCNTTGCNNNFLGVCAGRNNTTGCGNNFLGVCAGFANTTGFNNIFLGAFAGCNQTSGDRNFALGYNVRLPNTTGSDQLVIGSDANSWISGNSSFNVGIGTTNPTSKLHVVGNSFFTGVSTFSNVVSFSNNNIRIGDSTTGCSITSGTDNFFAGSNAGLANTSGYSNNFLGWWAGKCNTSGYSNNFLGCWAGKYNTTGYGNNFFGFSAGASNITGNYNNFFGRQTGYCNASGCFNNFIGYVAGTGNTTGCYNNFLGNRAGEFSISGNNNNFLGSYAGGGAFTGNCNTGSCNNFFGINAGRCNTGGGGNNFLGSSAGFANTTGSNNNFFGAYAGCSQTSGARNVALGYNVQLPNTTGSDQLVIGSGSTAWISGNSSFNVGVGTTNPTSKLHVVGNSFFTGIVTATTFSGNNIVGTSLSISGISTLGVTSTTNLTSQQLNVSGISTLGVTSTTNLTSQQLNVSGITTLGIITASSAYVTGIITASTFVSNVAQGTAPLTVSSTTLVTNLNADLLDDNDSTYYTNASNLSSGTVPSARITASSGDFTVGQNLYVTGNLSVGGTSAILNVATLQVNDKDIVLGIATNSSNQDVSTDFTANHGGIAIASTEGSPLIDINGGVGTDSIASTYKQIMWLKSGSWAGLNTDAWLFNYGVGIGSTQIPNGVRLAAGGMQVTDTTITTPQLNVTGVSTFAGITTHSASLFGTTASFTGVTTSGGINVTTGNDYKINGTSVLTNNTLGSGVLNSSLTSVGTLGQLNVTGVSTLGVTSTTNLTSQQLNVSGVSTFAGIATHTASLFGTQSSFTGVTTSGGVNVTTGNDYKINSTSVLSNNTLGTNVVNSSLTSVGTLGQLNVSGISTFSNGPVLIGGGTSTGTAGQVLQVSGINSSVYIGGSVGIGTTNPTSKLWVDGSGYFTGILTANRIFSSQYGEFVGGSISGTSVVGTSLSISGISTFTNGPVLIGSATSTGTASQRLQVTGGAYVSSNVGVAVTSPSFAVDVSGDARVQSTGKMRFGGTAGSTNFYIQFNSTTNSLDFVAG